MNRTICSVLGLITAWQLGLACAGDSEAQKPSGGQRLDVASELSRFPPVEPADAHSTFQVEPGFRMELVAAEPLVHDPVAMAFDERGRLFVVEMCDYSEQDHDFLGVIRLLEDTDGDGRFDRSMPFAENLSWPTAVICHGGGVFVGAAPDIWFLKDTDGDGQADERRKIFTGFGRDNVQGLLNSFQWGLDNRIHGATSSSGGEVRRVDATDAKPVSLRGRDFAFDPRTLALTAESGGAQHGLSFDDWGRKFVCSNSDHIQLVMFEDRYIARNPYLAPPSPRLSIAADGPQAEVYRISPVEPWRIVRTRLRVAGLVPGPVEGGGRAAGYFTSATGVTIFRGHAWPSQYQGNAFIGDVGSNIVHRKVLEPRGIEMIAKRPSAEKREFVACRDTWFRPAQFANAPDGALYIADVYREVIEHPLSLPPVIKQHLDLTSGRDRGRIYRVVAANHRQQKLPRLDAASSAELATALESPNGWHRDTAARLLYERQDVRAVAPLKRLAAESKSPLARMHALYALRGLDALDSALLAARLDDQHPHVREQAVRLAEKSAKADEGLQAKLLGLVGDPDPRVRYQLAFTLGELPPEAKVIGLTALAKRDAADRWMRLAILSSLVEGADDVFIRLLAEAEFRQATEHRELFEQLALQIGRQRRESAILAVLRSLDALGTSADGLAIASLLALADGLSTVKMHEMLDQHHFDRLSRLIAATAEQSLRAATDDGLAVQERVDAIHRLALSPTKEQISALSQLLGPRQPQPVQLAALSQLARCPDSSVVEPLLAAWPNLVPNLKNGVLEILFSRGERLPLVLTAIEQGILSPRDLDSTRIKLLLAHSDPNFRARVEKLFAHQPFTQRAKVIEVYQPALKLTGDAAAGKKLFEKSCSACHKLEGVGHELGPNLATIQNRGPETILVNVLDPNREVNPQFLNYLLVTDDGRSLTGMITAETATSVTLVRAENQRDTVLRANIDALQSTGMSLMPEGLEKDIEPQGMADLVAYLMSVK